MQRLWYFTFYLHYILAVKTKFLYFDKTSQRAAIYVNEEWELQARSTTCLLEVVYGNDNAWLMLNRNFLTDVNQ